VTYVIQRAESLVGLCFLLTLYASWRGGLVETRVVVCRMRDGLLLGMASKELMVSAPLMVLLYDRAFVGGSFREAWRRRYGLYLAWPAPGCCLCLWLLERHAGKSSGFGIEVVAGVFLHAVWGDSQLFEAVRVAAPAGV